MYKDACKLKTKYFTVFGNKDKAVMDTSQDAEFYNHRKFQLGKTNTFGDIAAQP